MKTLVLIAAGGSLGAVLRYLASDLVSSFAGKEFPYGTLFVNVTGSLLIGLLSVLLVDRLALDPEWRAALLVGVLGSYTTFSTFSLDTLNLIEQGNIGAAMTNMIFSVLICLAAAWVGITVARQL